MFNEQLIVSQWISDMYDQTINDIDDVEFLLTTIGSDPKKILEVACGSGRILIPLAKAGHKVHGIDFDEYILKKIKPKSQGMKNITWAKSDAINDTWSNNYEVVVLAANLLFNIISDLEYEKAQQSLIQKASNALVRGGHIYIDYGYTLYPEQWFGNSETENVIWEGTDSEGNFGRMSLLNSSFDIATGINKFTRKFELMLVNGETIKQEIPSLKHFATLEQIHTWLDSAGFKIKEEYGDYSRNPIGEKTSRAIIWAEKI